MKIQKKHATEVVDFFILFCTEGYQPFDDSESAFISKCFGFAKHHGMFEDKQIEHYTQKLDLPKVKKTARLDVTEADRDIILDCFGEVFGPRGQHEQSSDNASTERYLRKLSYANEDGTETE